MGRTIAILGLGYVGLPLALAFAKKFPGTIGFDVKVDRVESLRKGIDSTCEVTSEELATAQLKITSSEQELAAADFFVVAVPTPIDEDRRPDLRALRSASATVGRVMKKGAIVVYESTVYPGVTEEICLPVLAETSGLTPHVDFFVGYSPERINPGDREHTIDRIVKVVSGEDAKTLDIVADTYAAVVTAGVYRASSIKVAEAAKVIENTQRDLNIALMNELALIFDRLNIDTSEVLEAAGTKWNFLRFSPGLVGGHCIGVDPYYLTTKAEQVGYRPQVILAGRRINDGMGQFLAQKTVKLMIHSGTMIKGSRVGVLGITFKENVPDIRNSRVPDIIRELADFGAIVEVADPLASAEEVHEEYGLQLTPWASFKDLDAIILAVAHDEFRALHTEQFLRSLKPSGVVIDVKGILDRNEVPAGMSYWRL